MASPRTEETYKEVLLSYARSTGFWSAVAAVVGVIAAAAGGVLYVSIEEIRAFSVIVLIIGIILLFVALVLSPRAVAMFVVGRRGRYGANLIVMTIAFFVIMILVNFLLFRNPTRFDVTATRVFSLAPQTVQVLDGLNSTVRVHAFFIPNDPRTEFGRQQAEDLLDEFASRSRKFDYRFVDPELNRSVALQYDVKEYPTIVFEEVESGRQQHIFGLTEQDYVTGILVATGVDQKKVYYLTGHKEAGLTRDVVTGDIVPDGLDFALQGMQRDNYAIQALNLTQAGEVPEDAAVLLIAGPKQQLSKQEQDAIEEYAKRGGRIVALFDPGTPDSFVELVSQWGITLGQTNVADAISNVAGEMLTPLLQRANGQFFSRDDVKIAEQIDVTFFPEATSVQPIVTSEELPPFIRIVPLAVTTQASWLETDVENVNFDPGVDQRGPFFVTVVVEASGTLDETQRHNLAKFVIFGDSDFAKNKFFFSSDNADLFLNSVNWLAEDFELIAIRPKLEVVRELVVTTRERDFIKWSSWFLPPAVMILLGSIVWWRRR